MPIGKLALKVYLKFNCAEDIDAEAFKKSLYNICLDNDPIQNDNPLAVRCHRYCFLIFI